MEFRQEQVIAQQKKTPPKVEAGLAQSNNGDVYVIVVSKNFIPIEMRWSVTTEKNKVVGGFLLESVKFYPTQDKKQFQYKFSFTEDEVSNHYIKFTLNYWSIYSAEQGNKPSLRDEIEQEYQFINGKLHVLPTKETVEKVREAIERKEPNGENVAIMRGDFSADELNIIKFVPTSLSLDASEKIEANVIIYLPTFEIKDSKNVSAITDEGLGLLSIIFDQNISNEYLVNIHGSKSFDYEILAQEEGYIRIKFDETNLKWMKIQCNKM